MPELPEVETVRRGLEGFIVGRKIVKITTFCEKSLVGDSSLAEGRKILEVGRRGKALLIVLEGKLNLMIHLRMTGQLVYVGKERFAAGHPSDDFWKEMPGKHTRVMFELDDGSMVYFNDQRKFGFVKVLSNGEMGEEKFLQKLGPEPWELSAEAFLKRLQRRKNTSIKAAILDQTIIAGVGNIYADEGLYCAGIYPGRRVNEVSGREAAKLLEGICKVMTDSIESGGSTMKDYVKADGTKGNYLEKFAQVFRREGQACGRCGKKILKTRIAGRGTHYCPGCQK